MAEEVNQNPTTPTDTMGPQANATASGGSGGAGGQAVVLSYNNNYSTLMLVYTFLLNLANNENGAGREGDINLLLPLLQEAMEEEKKSREAFFNAIQLLGNQQQ